MWQTILWQYFVLPPPPPPPLWESKSYMSSPKSVKCCSKGSSSMVIVDDWSFMRYQPCSPRRKPQWHKSSPTWWGTLVGKRGPGCSRPPPPSWRSPTPSPSFLSSWVVAGNWHWQEFETESVLPTAINALFSPPAVVVSVHIGGLGHARARPLPPHPLRPLCITWLPATSVLELLSCSAPVYNANSPMTPTA